jgi:hypothetical protein
MATQPVAHVYVSCVYFLLPYSTIKQNLMNKRRLHLSVCIPIMLPGKQEKKSLLAAATLDTRKYQPNPCIELMMDSTTTTANI